MISAIKLAGLLLLILVGYHYINQPLGFSLNGSIATVVFGICLLCVYRGYDPDAGNWIGWGLITAGCLLMALISPFSVLLLAPAVMIVVGFRIAGLALGPSARGGGNGCNDAGGFFDGGGDAD